MSSIPTNEVLQRIDALCKERNWSLYRLAKESGVPYSSLSTMFSRNTQPTTSTIERLCRGFRISISDFFNTPPRHNPYAFILSDDEKFIIDMYRGFNTNQKNLLLAYIEGLSQKKR